MIRQGNGDNELRSLDELIKEITVDAYGEDERLSAVLTRRTLFSTGCSGSTPRTIRELGGSSRMSGQGRPGNRTEMDSKTSEFNSWQRPALSVAGEQW